MDTRRGDLRGNSVGPAALASAYHPKPSLGITAPRPVAVTEDHAPVVLGGLFLIERHAQHISPEFVNIVIPDDISQGPSESTLGQTKRH